MPRRRTDVASKRTRQTMKGGATTPVVTPRVNGALVKPASLSGRAAVIWDEFAPELVSTGMLTGRDGLMFALWCRLGAEIEGGGLSAALCTQFRLIGNDFGLSPSGKGRELSAPGAPRKPHKFFKD